MASDRFVARTLSAAFLADELQLDTLVERGVGVLGRKCRWLRPLALRVVEAYQTRSRPRRIELTRFILADSGFRRACERHDLRLAISGLPAPVMLQAGPAKTWSIVPLKSAGELANWLGLSHGELQWFADLRSLEGKHCQGPLRHYRYRSLTKRFGRFRLIESPKRRLKQIQHRLLRDILDQIPPHQTVHGFRRGRSVKTFVEPHAGKRVVIRIDLEDFFPTIAVARVQALFRTAGYPEEVADLLAALCVNTTPTDVWSRPDGRSIADWSARWRYGRPHLPQGAPSSPALANLCAYRLDCRLAGLARSADATYSRYADDLAFSGNEQLSRVAERFQIHVCATALEEGFEVNHRKTRIMRSGSQQRLAGLVINARPGIARSDLERLRAILTNCIRSGPASQNRQRRTDFRGHLNGRIAYIEMVNPAQGAGLRRLFQQIDW